MKNSLKLVAAAALSLAAVQAQAADSLRRYNINSNETTVSGLSSGAFMAHQFHLAQSDIINGAAIIAGGPYNCAKGKATFALYKCMQPTVDGGPQAAESLQMAKDAEAKGLLPPLSNIADDKVYVFAGTKDSVVNPVAGAAVRDLYKLLGVKNGNIRFVDNVPAGHANVTVATGNDCGTNNPDYIVKCNVDQAGDILKLLAGATKPPSATLSGTTIEFSQGEFAQSPASISMADTG